MTKEISSYIFQIENLLYDVHDLHPELIKEINSKRENASTEDTLSKAVEQKLHPDLIQLYTEYNGIKIDWISDDKKGIG